MPDEKHLSDALREEKRQKSREREEDAAFWRRIWRSLKTLGSWAAFLALIGAAGHGIGDNIKHFIGWK